MLGAYAVAAFRNWEALDNHFVVVVERNFGMRWHFVARGIVPNNLGASVCFVVECQSPVEAAAEEYVVAGSCLRGNRRYFDRRRRSPRCLRVREHSNKPVIGLVGGPWLAAQKSLLELNSCPQLW